MQNPASGSMAQEAKQSNAAEIIADQGAKESEGSKAESKDSVPRGDPQRTLQKMVTICAPDEEVYISRDLARVIMEPKYQNAVVCEWEGDIWMLRIQPKEGRLGFKLDWQQVTELYMRDQKGDVWEPIPRRQSDQQTPCQKKPFQKQDDNEEPPKKKQAREQQPEAASCPGTPELLIKQTQTGQREQE